MTATPRYLYDGRSKPVARIGTASRVRRSSYDGGYIGARFTKGRSAIMDFVMDAPSEVSGYTRSELMRKARWMRKNIGLPRAMAKDLARHSIGPGLFPIPATSNDRRNEEYFDFFNRAQKIADLSGKVSWHQYQFLKVGMKFFDGDAHTILTLSESGWPQFQMVRSHNVGNFDLDSADDRWKDGVRRNRFDRHVAYRVKTRNGGKTYPANFVLQSFLLEDGDQSRGVTCLAHGIPDLHDQLDILALEKATVKDHGRISRVITNRALVENDDDDLGVTDEEFLGHPDEPEPDELDPAIPLEKVTGSEVIRLAQNERLEAFASNRPSPAFMGFLDWLGRNVTAGCGMPYEFSWNPSGISSASQRAIQNRINAACEDWQRSEERDTLRFYQFTILAGIAMGEIKPVKDWWKVDIVPGAPVVTIDKGRDANIDIKLVKQGLLTLQAYHARRGKFWKAEAKQTKSELEFYSELDLTHPSKDQASEAVGTAPELSGRESDQEKEDEKEKKEAA